MRNIVFKRVTVVMLLLAMICSMLSISVFADGQDLYGNVYTMPERVPVNFSEMRTDTFDKTALDAAAQDMLDVFDSPGMLDRLKSDWNTIVDQYDYGTTSAYILYAQYMIDCTDTEKYAQYIELNDQILDSTDKILTAVKNVINSDYADAMKEYIGSERIIKDAFEYEAKTEEQFRLSNEQLEILQEYYDLIALGDKNAEKKAADIYLRLLDNIIAQCSYNGKYDNYAKMAYDMSFFRDFGPEDTDLLAQWAKDFAMPKMLELGKLLNTKLNMGAFYSLHKTPEEIIEIVKPFVTSISSEAEEAFNVMQEYGLYDIASSSTKNQGSFTTNFNAYGVPFIVINPAGNAGDIESLIHEFGHFLSWYVTAKPCAYQYDCYDTSEINSQGLEILMSYYADEIFGEDLFGTILVHNIYQMLSAIVDGCLFDEFQKTALAMRMDGTLNTPEDVINLYMDIEREYYGDRISWGHQWYYVHHTFEQPFYYISYATSATAALGFLTLAAEDFDRAVEKYNGLISLGNDYGFSATLDYLDMPNPLTEEGIVELTDGLGAFIDEIKDIFDSEEIPQAEEERSELFSSNSEIVYVNDEAGFAVSLDTERWTVYNDEQIRQAFGVSADMFNNSDINEYLESGQQLAAFMAVTNDGRDNMNIIIQKIPKKYAFKSESDLVDDNIDDLIASLSTGINVLDYETGLFEIAGKDHAAVYVHSDVQGQELFQIMVYYINAGMLYEITATSMYEDNTDAVLSNIIPYAFSDESPENITLPAADTDISTQSGSVDAVYENNDLQLGIYLDTNDWTVYDDEQIKEVFGISAEMFSVDSLTEYFESGQQLAEFMSVKNDGMANINIVSQKLPLSAAFLSEEAIAQASLEETVVTMSKAMNVLDYQSGVYEVAGKEHGALYIHSQLQEQDVYQIIIFIKSSGILYQITATSFMEDLTDDVLSTVAQLSANDNTTGTDEPSEKKSEVLSENCVYRNEDAGIAFINTDNWVIFDDEQIREIYGVSADMFNESELAQYFESGNIMPEFMASTADRLQNINIVAQKLPAMVLWMNDQQLAEGSAENTVKAVSGGMTVLNYETGTCEVGGKEHGALYIHSSIQGQEVYQTVVYIKSGNMLYQITASSTYKDITNDILNHIAAY